MNGYPMHNGWFALLVAIIRPVGPDDAFYLLETGMKIGIQEYVDIETEAMIQMRDEGYTWEYIGECFGVSKSSACQRVKRIKQRGRHIGTKNQNGTLQRPLSKL